MILMTLAAILVQESPRPADCVIFSINVQDFSYPKEGAETVARILDIHEKHGIPVDLYQTTTMTDLYDATLLRRLKESPAAAQRRIVVEYETHGLDLATGRPLPPAGAPGPQAVRARRRTGRGFP